MEKGKNVARWILSYGHQTINSNNIELRGGSQGKIITSIDKMNNQNKYTSVLLENISKVNEELLLLYLDPKFSTSTNFAEEEVLSPLTFYLGKILSIRLKDRNLSKKYYFLDINNKYDFDKRLAAKKLYIKSGTLPFYEILNDINEPFYNYNYINFDELISSDKLLMTKNKYAAEEVQKAIIRLSHNFEEPDLLIPLLKFFSEKMEKAYRINPIEKSNQFFLLSYLNHLDI